MHSEPSSPSAERQPNPGSTIVLPAAQRFGWVSLVWGACLVYAIVRYNVFKGVAWTHLPLYIVNKSAALGGIVFLGLAYLVGKGSRKPASNPESLRAKAKFMGLTGFAMLSMHALMSIILLSPATYEKFFLASGALNLSGEFTFLFGVLAYGCLLYPAIATLPYMYDSLGAQRWLGYQRMGYAALALGCGHTFAMGYQGWLSPSTWPGMLPPMTMLGFAVALGTLVWKLASGPTARRPGG